MIEINEVSKLYRESKTKSLDNVTLTIPEGSIIGLIGVNGAGKSTLLRIAAGIYLQDKGSVLVDGEPVYENNSAKAKIAYVSDEQFYKTGMNMKKAANTYATFRENFSLDKFYKLAEEFGLDVNKSFSGFSKGMKRQNDIITALSCEAKYMLCDETFDGLDPITRARVKKVFIENVVDRGSAILLSSHNLQELEDLCDRIILLDKGKLLFSAEIDDLKGSVGKYQIMFSAKAPFERVIASVAPESIEQSGRIVSFIAAGSETEVEEKIRAAAQAENAEIAYFEALPLSLDEIFSYKLKVSGKESVLSGLSGVSESVGKSGKNSDDSESAADTSSEGGRGNE